MGLFSRSYDSLLKKGIRELDAGRVDWAIHYLLQAIEKDPSQPIAHSKVADLFFMVGDKEKARQHGEQAVQLFDAYISNQTTAEAKAEAWWQKGVTLGGLSRGPERDACWREADRLMPGYSSKGASILSDAIVKALSKQK